MKTTNRTSFIKFIQKRLKSPVIFLSLLVLIAQSAFAGDTEKANLLRKNTGNAYHKWGLELVNVVKNIEELATTEFAKKQLWESQKLSIISKLKVKFNDCVINNDNPGKTNIERIQFCAEPLKRFNKDKKNKKYYQNKFFAEVSAEAIKTTLSENGVERGK